jgi:hypothetical protein
LSNCFELRQSVKQGSYLVISMFTSASLENI